MSLTNTTKSDKKKMSKPKKKDIIISFLIIGIALGGTFGVFAILKAALHTDIPLVVVISESMEPTIYRGDLLVVEGKDADDILNGTAEDLKGDIVIYNASGLFFVTGNEPIVHRVIGKEYNTTEGKWYFITKGDNNDYPDNYGRPFSEDRILGVVKTIVPKVGYPKIWLSESGAGIYMIVILGILLIISIVWDLTHPEDEEQDEKQKALDAIKKEQVKAENETPSDSTTTNQNQYNLGI